MELPHDYHSITEWTPSELVRTARALTIERDGNPIPRQAEAADHALGHVAFELWARKNRDTPSE